MDAKLSVVLQIDLEDKFVNIAVSGSLTETTQKALRPLIQRARSLGVAVSIDLSGAGRIEPAGLDLLRQTIANVCSGRPGSPVKLLVPEPLPGQLGGPEAAAYDGSRARARSAR
ncbi:hypothetical protein HER39_01665, partial [Arthrobacter deserti]|nr:hypothetical protein [Arthrobacter deserti]